MKRLFVGESKVDETYRIPREIAGTLRIRVGSLWKISRRLKVMRKRLKRYL